MWTNDYISGNKEDNFYEYFKQNISDLKADSRYVGNVIVQRYCEKYEQLLFKFYIEK